MDGDIMICTFLGHRDTPQAVKQILRETVIELIEVNKKVIFYVGTNGAFDNMTQAVLQELSSLYPSMRYYITLAYLPVSEKDNPYKNLPTIYPDGIETVPKRFAISFRNKYMVSKCDTVICYVKHSQGGAAQFIEKARKQGKNIINLALAK